MDKKQVCKLKPGTFVEILWTDSKPTVGMILKKPVHKKSDIAITLLHCDSLEVDSHAVHTQITKVLGKAEFPEAHTPQHVRFVVPKKSARR
jgi:hypothetical protein